MTEIVFPSDNQLAHAAINRVFSRFDFEYHIRVSLLKLKMIWIYLGADTSLSQLSSQVELAGLTEPFSLKDVKRIIIQYFDQDWQWTVPRRSPFYPILSDYFYVTFPPGCCGIKVVLRWVVIYERVIALFPDRNSWLLGCRRSRLGLAQTPEKKNKTKTIYLNLCGAAVDLETLSQNYFTLLPAEKGPYIFSLRHLDSSPGSKSDGEVMEEWSQTLRMIEYNI